MGGGEAPLVFVGGVDIFDFSSDDLGLGCIRDPTGCGEHDVAVEDQLQKEEEFFGAGSDEDVVGVDIDVVFFSVELGDGFAEGLETGDGEVVFFVSVHFEGFNDGYGNGKGRLSESQAIDGAAFFLQFTALFVDSEGGGLADTAGVQIETDMFLVVISVLHVFIGVCQSTKLFI